MGKRIYDDENIHRIGTHADNIPHKLVSYAPGIDQNPTQFAIDHKTGKIYAFVDKKDEFFGNELGSLPKLGECLKYIIEHGQDVTEKVQELIDVSNFHAIYAALTKPQRAERKN